MVTKEKGPEGLKRCSVIILIRGVLVSIKPVKLNEGRGRGGTPGLGQYWQFALEVWFGEREFPLWIKEN